MKLSSVINPEYIFFGVKGKNAESVYREILSRMLINMDLHTDIQSLVGEMLERENATGVVYEGVAYPHLRLNGYDDLGFAIGILEKPVQLRPDDLGESKMVIMSLVGEKVGDFYLKTLAAALRYLSKPANLDRLAGTQTAEAFLARLDRDGVMVKKNLTAEDIMDRNCETITPDKTLREAFDQFTRTKCTQLAVTDDTGKLIGILDAVDIIAKFIPEYIMMMPNTQFMESFETFDALNREETVGLVRDFMRKEMEVVPPDTPLFRCTIELCRRKTEQIFVTDRDGKLAGQLSIRNIIHRVLRG